jgi:anti-anti-sigma regulatory factor
MPARAGGGPVVVQLRGDLDTADAATAVVWARAATGRRVLVDLADLHLIS